MGNYTSTNEVDERTRLSYWNDLVCHNFPRVEVTPLLDEPFFGAIRADQLASVKYAEVTTRPSLVTRSKQAISQMSGDEFVKIIYQLVGETIFSHEGRTAKLSYGDWVFLDCTQPYRLKHPLSSYENVVLVFQFPKHIFSARLPNPESLTGYAINSRSGLGKITLDFIQSLRTNLSQINSDAMPQLAETLVNLFATNLKETLYPDRTFGRNQDVILLEAKSFIQKHLSNSDLSTTIIAEALNISKSYLYLIFQGEETTVNRYIWELRLEKCRADLANPLYHHRSITDIAFAWGFKNSTHFSKLFKQRYDMSARAYRNFELNWPSSKTREADRQREH